MNRHQNSSKHVASTLESCSQRSETGSDDTIWKKDLTDRDSHFTETGKHSLTPSPRISKELLEHGVKEIESLETQAYHSLVEDFGRPLYPLSQLPLVLRSPEDFQEHLRPFWTWFRLSYVWDEYQPSEVFQRQRKRWKDFRHWQRDNRNIPDLDDGFTDYLADLRKDYEILGYVEGLRNLDGDLTSLKEIGGTWDRICRKRSWQKVYQREPGCQSFNQYQEAARARLRRHDCIVTLHLHRNPKLQDALTTWTEYLCFECWWLDWFDQVLESLTPDYDARLLELQGSGAFDSHETTKRIRNPVFASKCYNEVQKYRDAVKSAEAEAQKVIFLTQRDENRFKISEQKRIDLLITSKEKLLSARKRYENAEIRLRVLSNFREHTSRYTQCQEDRAYQKIRVEWAESQLRDIQTSEAQSRGTKRKASLTLESPVSSRTRSRTSLLQRSARITGRY